MHTTLAKTSDHATVRPTTTGLQRIRAAEGWICTGSEPVPPVGFLACRGSGRHEVPAGGCRIGRSAGEGRGGGVTPHTLIGRHDAQPRLPPFGHRDRDRRVGGCGRGHRREDPRQPQDPAGAASPTEVRRPGRGRCQPPHGSRRRRADQGQPRRRRRLGGGALHAVREAAPVSTTSQSVRSPTR